MGTVDPRLKLQQFMERGKMTEQNLVPTKSFQDNWNMQLDNQDIFKINKFDISNQPGSMIKKQNTIIRNQTSSTVKQSSVITKKVVRKKRMMVNGEWVEEEEECEEIVPSNAEFCKQSEAVYAKQDIQGSSETFIKKADSFRQNMNWTANDNQMDMFSNMHQGFNHVNTSQRMMSQNISEQVMMRQNKLSSESMSFSGRRTEARMMAFQSSVNGVPNTQMINMEANQEEFSNMNPIMKNIQPNNNSNLPDMKKLSITNGEPEKKKTERKSLLQKLGLSKKKEEVKVPERTGRIIEEFLNTEQAYIEQLRTVVEEFMPVVESPNVPKELRENPEEKYALFGNIEHIFMFHDVQFQIDLRNCNPHPQDIANCFLKHGKEFALYRHYNRNKPFTESRISKYEHFFSPIAQKKMQEGSTMCNLQSYLITPTQRIARYILLLEEISKDCKKNKLRAEEVNAAIDMLKKEIKLGNDLMALDALKKLPPNLDVKAQGELIYRDKFVITPPEKKKKYEAMVFLFKEMIIISDVQLEHGVDYHYFKDFIPLTEVGLTECSNDPKQFKIWYLKHNKKNYTLHTKDEKVKTLWVTEIKNTLENELKKLKDSRPNTATYIDLTQNKFL